MKSLFFVSVAVGIFSGTSISVKAQTNVNLERLASTGKSKTSLKFIESIELVPESASATQYSAAPEATEPVKNTIIKSANAGGTAIEKCTSLQYKYGMLINSEVELISNIPLYSFIDEWWGTRYSYGGSTKKGIDCSAFTGKLIEDVYSTTLPRTAKDQYSVCEKISRDELKEGDLVFFNTRGGISHVGVYLGNSYFVHSSTTSGVTISSLDEEYYDKRYVNGGRVN